jgi:hypothetical protein
MDTGKQAKSSSDGYYWDKPRRTCTGGSYGMIISAYVLLVFYGLCCLLGSQVTATKSGPWAGLGIFLANVLVSASLMWCGHLLIPRWSH